MKQSPAKQFQSFRTLLLIRHGKAAPQDVGLSDFERILTDKGVEESIQVASQLASRSGHIDLLISSAADRALETAHIFAERLGYSYQKIKVADVLYATDMIAPMVGYLRQLPFAVKTVAICGHNPSFDRLATYLMAEFNGQIPKSGVVACELPRIPWSSLKKGCGRMQYFLTPSPAGAQRTS